MKIGILTFHRATNYGAVLQSFGLYKTLQSYGHDVEVIDYRPKYIEKYRRAIALFDIKREKGLLAKIKLLLISFLGIRTNIETAQRFDKFINRVFKLSSSVLSPEQMPKGYDIIFIGSDQIWSPQICFGFDEIYWGQFPHDNTRLFTYAASIGGHNHLNNEEWRKAGHYLKAFERISVREKQLQKDLKEHLDIHSELVVDPTILVNESVFDELAEKPKDMPYSYVLVFSVAPTDNLMGFAEKVANETNSKIVKLSAYNTPWVLRRGKKKTVSPTVEEFLGWFKYAKCVVTVSFHGTVFSVLFRKDFYSLSNYMQDRAEHFLRSLNLANRLVSSDSNFINDFSYTSVDYSGVEERLAYMKEHSINFVTNSLRGQS